MQKEKVYPAEKEYDPYNPFEISTSYEENNETQNNKNSRTTCEIIMILIGIFFFVISIIDAVVFFTIPYMKIKENKHKYKDAQFEKVNRCMVLLHFVIHGFLCLFGLFFIISFCKKNDQILSFNIVFLSLIIISWLLQFAYCTNKDYKPDLMIDDLFKLINNNPPLDFINVKYEYIKSSSISTNNFFADKYQTYSSKNVVVPVKTNITSKIYTYNDFPDIFSITILQEIIMSDNLCEYFRNNLSINYDVNHLVSNTYLVSKQNNLLYLSKKTRIISEVFGVGIYYELYSKSIPKMVNKITLTAEIM